MKYAGWIKLSSFALVLVALSFGTVVALASVTALDRGASAKKPPPAPPWTVDVVDSGDFAPTSPIISSTCSGTSNTAGAFDGPELGDHTIKFWDASSGNSCLSITADDGRELSGDPFMVVKQLEGVWKVSLRISDAEGVRFETDFVPASGSSVEGAPPAAFTLHVHADEVALKYQKKKDRKKPPVGYVAIGDLQYAPPAIPDADADMLVHRAQEIVALLEEDSGGGAGITVETRFLRGDADGSGSVRIADCAVILEYLFLGTYTLTCLSAADANDDGAVNISDSVFALNSMFLGGPSIPPPYPECGRDPTPGELTCEAFAGCVK